MGDGINASAALQTHLKVANSDGNFCFPAEQAGSDGLLNCFAIKAQVLALACRVTLLTMRDKERHQITLAIIVYERFVHYGRIRKIIDFI